MTQLMTEFRVWIGCLACYNGGDLVGQWYDAAEAGEVTSQQVHWREGQDSLAGNYVAEHHEELWCFDVEAPISGWCREMSPSEASLLASGFEEAVGALSNCPPEAYLLWLGNMGVEPSHDSASDAEEHYCGEYPSFREYADERADEVMGLPMTPCAGDVWDSAMRDLSSRMAFAVEHFNYESHARDMEHDHTVLDSETGVYVFFN